MPPKKRDRTPPQRRAVLWRTEWACPACGAPRQGTKMHDPNALLGCAGNPPHLVLPTVLPCGARAMRRVHQRFGLGVELAMMVRMTRVIRVRQPVGLNLSDELEVDAFLGDLYRGDECGEEWSLDASWGSEPGTHTVFDVEGKRN